MPFGQSNTGLECLSVYRASVAQRVRTQQHAQYVGSMIIWFHLQRRGGEFAANQGGFFAEQRRDYIVANRNGDTTGRLDRVGAAGSA